MTDDEGVWVYAVTTDDSFPGGISGIMGVAGESLRTVSDSGFAAVVGSVELAKFGEDALRRNLEDLDWLSETARRHDAVVSAICAGGATVPLRLATVYYDEDRVREMLRANASELVQALHRITDRTEWGVRCYEDRAQRAERTAQADATERPSGTAYLMRRKARLAAQEEADAAAARYADDIYAELARLSVAAVRQPPTPPTLSRRDSREILNASYLVENPRAREFTEAVESIDARIPDVDTVLTGPWPPYSFTAVASSAP